MGSRRNRLLAVLVGLALCTVPSSPAVAQTRQAPIGLRVVAGSGQVLTDQFGFSLYWYEGDEIGVSNCTGSCLEDWRPLLWDPGLTNEDVMAEMNRGPLGFIVRGDGGGIQVTWDGAPAYYWRGDMDPGDVLGEGAEPGWHVLTIPPVL